MKSNAGRTRKLLLAASTGGHLSQLVRLSPQLGASDDSLWITFDTSQSRSLLAGKRVLYVPYIAPRDGLKVATGFREIRRHLKSTGESFDEAVSTGSALAVAALCAAHLHKIPTRYIESVSRTDGPSMSGRILAASRFSALQTQHPGWASGRWSFDGSVMNSYATGEASQPSKKPRLFVTLGTIKPYRFDAMVDAVLETGLCDDNTVWQLGCTERSDLPGTTFGTVLDSEFTDHIQEADVVISHSGVGSILRILDEGKFPVVLTRRKERGEHVDDHQQQIARLIESSGIGFAREVDELTADDIRTASGRLVSSAELV